MQKLIKFHYFLKPKNVNSQLLKGVFMKNVLFLFLVLSLQARAQIFNNVEFSPATMGGTGCKINDGSFTSVNQKTITVDYRNLAHINLTGQAIERLNCSVRLPVVLKPGFKIVLNDYKLIGQIRQNKLHDVQFNLDIGIVGSNKAQIQKKTKLNQTGSILVKGFSIDISKKKVTSVCQQPSALVSLDLSSLARNYAKNLQNGLLNSEIDKIELNYSIEPCN